MKREAPGKRAESSRSQKIHFLKQFIHKLVTDEGNCGYLNHSVGHPYEIYI